MKRNLSIFLLLTIFFISCNKNNDNSNDQKKMIFWHFWSEPYQKSKIDSLVFEFEKKSGIDVEISLLSWNDGKTKLLAAFNSQSAPDVLELGSDWVLQFASAGVLSEFSNQKMNQFLEFTHSAAKYKDKYYALPWIVDTRVLFVNRKLLKKAGFTEYPKTFDELYFMSEKINSLSDVYGIGINGSDPHKLYKKVLPFMWSYGGNILNGDNVIMNSESNKNAISMYCKLSSVGLIETQRQIDAEFTKGKIGFCISGSWLLDKIEKENPALDFQACLMPGLTSEKPGFSFAGAEYLTISALSNKQESAKEFVDFMTDGINSLKFCKKINVAGFPADKKYFSSPELTKNPNKAVFAEQLKYSKMTPIHKQWLDIEPAFEDGVVSSLYGKESVEHSIENIHKEILLIIK